MEINTKTFFTVGLLAFFIMGIANTANFIIFFKQGNFFSHLASIAQIIFNFITAGFFWYLLRTTSMPGGFDESSAADIQNAFDEIVKKEELENENIK